MGDRATPRTPVTDDKARLATSLRALSGAAYDLEAYLRRFPTLAPALDMWSAYGAELFAAIESTYVRGVERSIGPATWDEYELSELLREEPGFTESDAIEVLARLDAVNPLLGAVGQSLRFLAPRDHHQRPALYVVDQFAAARGAVYRRYRHLNPYLKESGQRAPPLAPTKVDRERVAEALRALDEAAVGLEDHLRTYPALRTAVDECSRYRGRVTALVAAAYVDGTKTELPIESWDGEPFAAALLTLPDFDEERATALLTRLDALASAGVALKEAVAHVTARPFHRISNLLWIFGDIRMAVYRRYRHLNADDSESDAP
jgi:hypothetical protein